MKSTQRGFTLIEVMMSVAVLGVIAGLGATNYLKLASKSKQSEAKAALASLFTSEKNYFMEYNEYITRFDVLGFRPDGTLYYNVGFSGLDRGPSATAQGMGSPTGLAACRNACTGTAALAEADCYYDCGPQSAASTCPAGCAVSGARCKYSARISWQCAASARTAVFSSTGNGAPLAESIQGGDALNRFRALAAGRPNRQSDDQWTMDQNRNLINFRSGF